MKSIEYWKDDNQAESASETRRNRHSDTNEVFIVHGRNEGTKNNVKMFLKTLGLDPVILHEQPNEGLTTIEKFERHAEVAYVIVLLTPDDIGYLASEEDKARARARQNVIFELGYFVGSLGRDRVCALIKEDVEKPSDYDGVMYVSLDDPDGWMPLLVKELKAAGLDVDGNHAP